MNLYAYDPADPNRTLIDIETWLTQNGPDALGRCRICHKVLKVKAEKSQRQTHFAHEPHSGCPTVDENHKPYAGFRDLPRDPTVATAAKAWALENIDGIYDKIKKISPGLTWRELHALLKTAREEDIWSLKDMPREYIPYVLLTCVDVFKANNFGRAKDTFFVLEASPETGEYWNFPAGYKRYIWEVTLPARTVKHLEMKLETPVPWYMPDVRKYLA
ncbi:hypothetical protein [Paraburkholderia sp. MM6662-R1]|uniref:hypothetical protein n=1 Tax=Paraburkholderia sp. MM6662-R1 TaxID=2991066 RepID=UPI003D1E9E5D